MSETNRPAEFNSQLSDIARVLAWPSDEDLLEHHDRTLCASSSRLMDEPPPKADSNHHMATAQMQDRLNNSSDYRRPATSEFHDSTEDISKRHFTENISKSVTSPKASDDSMYYVTTLGKNDSTLYINGEEFFTMNARELQRWKDEDEKGLMASQEMVDVD
ncbi:hypothetical protein MMC08_006539 [Hypocenomyce scalaris]|nr:hypothetical protein [Hypocenomyce scalaris]